MLSCLKLQGECAFIPGRIDFGPCLGMLFYQVGEHVNMLGPVIQRRDIVIVLPTGL